MNEIRIDSEDAWFRVMYVARFDEVIYVLHTFSKETRHLAKRYRNCSSERAIALCLHVSDRSQELAIIAGPCHFRGA